MRLFEFPMLEAKRCCHSAEVAPDDCDCFHPVIRGQLTKRGRHRSELGTKLILPHHLIAAPGRRQGRSISWSLLMELMPATAAQEHTKFVRTDTIMPTLYTKVRMVDDTVHNVYV